MLKAFSRAVVAPLMRLVFRPRIIGRRNVPKHGGVLLASNHLAFIDSVVITLVARRSVSFMVKDDYFRRPGLRGWINRTFFESIGAVPVDRRAGKSAQDALDAGLRILEDGSAFSIYPEGTRSRDGRIYRGRTGVAWLAMNAGVPVVPVALTGTGELQPVGGERPRRARITVQFGEPLDLSAYGDAASGRARRAATDAVMAAIRRMSGQEEARGYNRIEESDEPAPSS